MAKVFVFSEIINFAIEKEIQSFELYKKLAGLAKKPIVKKLFTELMKQERKHEEYFENMLAKFENSTKRFLIDEEYKLYVQEMIASGRKTAPINRLDYNNLDTVLNYAIAREQDSILFYSAFTNLLKKAEQKNYLYDIIRAEGKHIKKILEIKQELKK